ncbi:iron-sulfur cluster repair di-iron protein [Muriicola sp. E247]|uniref:iron-sulfur cluster repair di-iron protein n=1 Tax=unclassified Muriicola TaxID=2647561 RepID=UPI00350EEFD6
MNSLLDKEVGQIVAEDYRSAAVFSKYGIDFCCNGNRNLYEVCSKKKVEVEIVVKEIEALTSDGEKQGDNFNTLPLNVLADHIEQKHHRYVEERIPILKQYLHKINTVHGERHPELKEIYRLFSECAGELTMHMKKEELVLFPFIRKMVLSLKHNEAVESPRFLTVTNPIQTMRDEHESAGDIFSKISSLTHSYTPPSDACSTYKVAFLMLKEFEEDLHLHVHLENNILFPKAEKLEREMVLKMPRNQAI